MRDVILTLMVLGSVPFIVVSPFFGLLVFTWFALMSPHRLTWGFAANAPFAMMVGAVTLLAWLFSREPKKLPVTLLSVLFILWALWISLTTATAQDPTLALHKYDVAIKAALVTLLGMVLVNSRERIDWFVWAVALSIGFYGVKGGLWWVMTGGKWSVVGPYLTQIQDNNALAMALTMVLPLFYYLQLHAARHRLVRLGLWGALGLCTIGVVGTYSRGGLLALAVAAGFLVWKSRSRFILGALAAIALFASVPFIPQKWMDRMSTIETYEQDGSANLRFLWWGMSLRLAKDFPVTGAGFNAFHNANLYPKYHPEADRVRDVHSIYFEVLGEHGYPGLAIFVSMIVAAYFSCASVIRRAKRRVELHWAADLARMLQVMYVAYAIAGGLLTLATMHLFYQLLGLTVALHVTVRRLVREAEARERPPAVPQWRRVPELQPVAARQPAAPVLVRRPAVRGA